MLKKFIAIASLTIFMTGPVVDTAAAKSRHHHRHHHHHHHRDQAQPISNPVDAASLFEQRWIGEASISALFQNAVRAPVQALTKGVGRTFSGMASYYGNEAGSRTASGQRFNQGAMTAAHRSLPFGTKVRVTHGDRSVVVTINDRGPFIRGRVIDLSKGAASAIGLTSRGVGHVVAEIM